MNGFTRLMPGGVIWFILLLVFLSGCSGGSAMLPDVDSDSSSQPSDGAASNVEMDLFNSYSSSERTLIDAYELTFNKKTNEATIAQLRTALVHYNGTPHAYGILCPNCLTPSLDPWIVQNSIEVHIDAINLYFDDGWYYAYDLRAIFVQVDTDEEEEFIYDSFEIVSPECDSTDIWFPWDETDPNPDPDESTALDPTNPFFPLYFDDYCYFDDEDYEEYQRILPPTTSPEEEIDFTLALNFNDAPDDDDDFMHALIMFDVCWFPSKYDIPNCHEPYRITFSEEDGMYPHIVAGNELEVDIRIYDHACDQGEDNNYWDDIDGDVFFYASNDLGGDLEDISADFGSPTVDPYPGGDMDPGQDYSFIIEPDEDLDAGLYEGVIVITDTEANRTLKRKIWVTVEKQPEEPSDEVEITDVLYVSDPVRADLNHDSSMDTIFTADYWLWGIGLDWDDPERVDVTGTEAAGEFVGVPTIVDVDSDEVEDILLAFCGTAPINNYIYAIDGSNGDVMWSTWLHTKPVSHPIAILDGSGDVESIFLVCTGGYDSFHEPSPAMVLFDENGDLVDLKQGPDLTEPCPYGPPAILERDDTTYAFVMQNILNGVIRPQLEAWDVGNLEEECIAFLLAAGVSATGPHTPTIGYVDDGQSTHDLIYAPSTNALTLFEWEDPYLSYVAARFNLTGSMIPYDGRVVLGDMNRDGYQDVVFGYDGGVAVYTGYVPSDPLNMSLQEIWDYEDIGGFTGWYAPPVLIDCNGDSYLDVITGFSFDGGNPPDHRLLVLDGSPYNNNYRIDDTERIIFTWDPGPLTWEVCGQSPFLSETGDGTLEIGALFTDEGAGDVLYQLVDTLFGFHHPDYESYQREPWLKAFYSLSNWNNPEEDGPEY